MSTPAIDGGHITHGAPARWPTATDRDEQLVRLHEALPRVFTEPDGACFTVDGDDVFSPLVGLTSRMMGEVVTRCAPGCEVLIDVGCGLGYLGIKAAAAGIQRVALLDIHRPAVESARRNVERNRHLFPGARVEVLESDLYAALPSDVKADLITFNHPFYPSDGRFGLGADGGESIVRSFLDASPPRLAPGGAIIMSFADFVDPRHDPRRIAAELGLDVRIALQRATASGNTGSSYVYAITLGRAGLA